MLLQFNELRKIRFGLEMAGPKAERLTKAGNGFVNIAVLKVEASQVVVDFCKIWFNAQGGR